MAFGSCEVLAPKVFVLEKNKINPKVRIVSEDGASFEDILSRKKPVLQRLLELLIDTVVSKSTHNLCAFRGINFIPRPVFQIESVEDYLF